MESFIAKQWSEYIESYYQPLENDGYEYESGIDFNQFRYENKDALLAAAGYELPFEETISYEQYKKLINDLNSDNINPYLLADKVNIQISPELENNLLDLDDIEYYIRDGSLEKELFDLPNLDDLEYISIEMPQESAVSDLTKEILDEYGVPNKWFSELESPSDFPDSLKILTSENPDLDDFADLQTHNESYLNTKNLIDSLEKKILSESDTLTQKAFILAIYSIIESFLKSTIASSLPDINSEVKHPLYKKILNQALTTATTRKDKLQALYKEIFRIPLEPVPHRGLRNALAHSIDIPTIKDDEITYLERTKKKGEQEQTVKLDALFKELNSYLDKIKGDSLQ